MTSTDSTPPIRRPRLRIGAALWGLVLIAAGVAALWVVATPAHRANAVSWMLGLDATGWTVIAVSVAGGTLTLIAVAAVARSLARRDADRA